MSDEVYSIDGAECTGDWESGCHLTDAEFADLSAHDQKNITALVYGDFSAYETLVKMQCLLRQGEVQAYKHDDKIRDRIMKVYIGNVFASCNGRVYVALKILGGATQVGISMASMSPGVAKSLLGRIGLNLSQWDLNDPIQAASCSRYLAKIAPQWSQIFDIPSSFKEQADKAWGDQNRSLQSPLNNQEQNSSTAKQGLKGSQENYLRMSQENKAKENQVKTDILR